MALNPAQIEIVREIIGVNSLAEVAARAALQTNEQNARTIADIAQWEKYNNQFARLENGDIRQNPDDALLRICNRVRVRFGYLKVGSLNELQSQANAYCVMTPPLIDDCRYRKIDDLGV